MLRRIVVLRNENSLRKAWQKRSMKPAHARLEKEIRVKGCEIDAGYHPVSIPGLFGVQFKPTAASGFQYAHLASYESGRTFGVRMTGDDEEAFNRLRHDRADDVIGVFADPSISVFPTTYCGSAAVGKTSDVVTRLGVRTLHRKKVTGKRVRIAVVDTGINGSIIPVADGWSPDPSYEPGAAPTDHGTMVAFDAKIAAPDARILDYALLRSTGETWTAFLSDAIAAFANLIGLMSPGSAPLVVNNSWGMFDRSEDAPIGSPENYSANIEHPFNQIVRALVAAGADVFFAAGNCGAHCPDPRCGLGDRGPGASIHGANSHPDVITVAATTVTHRRLGYSSQGPGGLDRRKPDLAAYSHFSGSGVYPVDGGTSAASPVACGVAAALRQRFSPKRLAPTQLKGVLQRTAIDLEGDGWDFDLGYGILNAAAAWKSLTKKPASRRRASRVSRRRTKR